MSTSFLGKVFGRGRRTDSSVEPFSLPGALHDGVRVLFLHSGDPTELLFVMPFVEAVRQSVDDAQLGILCSERISHLALSCDMFDDVIVIEDEDFDAKGSLGEQMRQALASEPWDVAILTGADPDPAREELALASGAVLRLGPGHPGAYPRINCELRSSESGEYPYARTELWGRLVGLDTRVERLLWPLPEKRLRQSAQLVHFNKPRKDQILLGVDPGVGKEGTALAVENLAFLANHITEHIPSKTIVLTADEEPTRAERLEQKLRGEKLDLPRPTLLEKVLLVSQCDLFLSGNTDLFHFAAARDVPSLAVFTPDDGSNWNPTRASSVRVIHSRPNEELDLASMMDQVEALLR